MVVVPDTMHVNQTHNVIGEKARRKSISMALLHVKAAAATLLRAQRTGATPRRFAFSTEATDAAAAALRMVKPLRIHISVPFWWFSLIANRVAYDLS